MSDEKNKREEAKIVNLAKMKAHPLRVRILAAIGRDTKSPNMLADELNEPLGNVSYHVGQLRDGGAIELDRTEPRRGAVEHFYRLTAPPTTVPLTFSGRVVGSAEVSPNGEGVHIEATVTDRRLAAALQGDTHGLSIISEAA